MNNSEAKIVKRHIAKVFASWHGCSLPLSQIRKGSKSNRRTLCDDCRAYIKAHMQDIASEIADSGASQ